MGIYLKFLMRLEQIMLRFSVGTNGQANYRKMYSVGWCSCNSIQKAR